MQVNMVRKTSSLTFPYKLFHKPQNLFAHNKRIGHTHSLYHIPNSDLKTSNVYLFVVLILLFLKTQNKFTHQNADKLIRND